MGKQILESNNYKKFEMTDFNRDVKKTNRLEISMRKHGWIDANPLHVIRNGDGRFKIKQGHHRFVVAQKLGIPIKYVECKDSATIYELESTTKPWSMEDYLTSYCRTELPEYFKVRKYCDESGISLNMAISLLGGETAGSGNFQQEFKEGRYKVRKDCDHAETVKSIVLYIKKWGITFFNNPLLVQAVSKSVWVSAFNIAQFKSKIKLFHGMLEKKANLDQYLDMLEEIYNRQSRAKVPLKFLALEEAKRRKTIAWTKPNARLTGHRSASSRASN